MAKRKSIASASESDWGNRKRRGEDSDLDITPMIDVTFLLLIFFMVTSTMQATPDLDVPPAKHGIGADAASSMIVMIAKPESVDGDPTIVMDGKPGDAGIEDLQEFVQEGLGEDKNHVIIKADREVPHGFVQKVARAVNEFEGVTFSIGVRDKD